MSIDKKDRALTLWKKSEKSLENYRNYIKRKGENKFQLSLIDLLYISNFKGGNASIHEEEHFIANKLKQYSCLLLVIEKNFAQNKITDLSQPEVEQLVQYSQEFLNLSKKLETAIDGFKSSFLSALLHAYFPDLFPILDRRVLMNLEIITSKNIYDGSGQVKNISQFYPELILKFQERCRALNTSVREVDKLYFIKQLPVWVKGLSLTSEG